MMHEIWRCLMKVSTVVGKMCYGRKMHYGQNTVNEIETLLKCA